MSSGNIILDYGDSLIRESEMQILKSNEWLNDAIIEFYFEYLGNQSAILNCANLKFYGPAVTQLVKMSNSNDVPCMLGEVADTVQYQFWPVNDSSEAELAISGSHWSLLVFSQPDNKFLHFDSSSTYNEPAAIKLYRKLSPTIAATATFHTTECYAQANGRDCGLHVLKNASLVKDFIINSRDSSGDKCPILWKNSQVATASPKEAEKLRAELIELILNLTKKQSS